MLEEESILDLCSPDRQKTVPMSSGGVPILQPGAINVYAIIPCPLKVRFKIALEEHIARNNAAGEMPIYCPTMLDGSPKGIEDQMMNAVDEDGIPDVLITTGLGTVFSRRFRSQFLDTKMFTGLTKPEFLDVLPADYVDAAKQYNIGFLAFGAWSLVWDLSFGEDMNYPRSWTDLAKPEFRNQLAMHGYHGKASGASLLMVLKKRAGQHAISDFASNIKNVQHFAEVIKGINSPNPNRAPFNILPNAASSQMPSRKNAAILEFEDGPLMAPLFMFVKTSRLEQSRKVVDFFWSDTFRSILAAGDFHMPDRMDWSKKYTYPNWDELAERDFIEVSNSLNDEFVKSLPKPSCGCGSNASCGCNAGARQRTDEC